jgi:hypothetical protein
MNAMENTIVTLATRCCNENEKLVQPAVVTYLSIVAATIMYVADVSEICAIVATGRTYVCHIMYSHNDLIQECSSMYFSFNLFIYFLNSVILNRHTLVFWHLVISMRMAMENVSI